MRVLKNRNSSVDVSDWKPDLEGPGLRRLVRLRETYANESMSAALKIAFVDLADECCSGFSHSAGRAALERRLDTFECSLILQHSTSCGLFVVTLRILISGLATHINIVLRPRLTIALGVEPVAPICICLHVLFFSFSQSFACSLAHLPLL